MITASTSGIGKPMIRARNVNQSVFPIALANRGSAMTRAKLSRPTQLGVPTRFVSWTLMTIARRIGNHEKSPKIPSIGRRNTNVLRPSRLSRSRDRAGFRATFARGTASFREVMRASWLPPLGGACDGGDLVANEMNGARRSQAPFGGSEG